MRTFRSALAGERARDLDELLLGDREVSRAGVEREIPAPYFAQRGARDTRHLGAVDPPEPCRLAPQGHVLGHRHVGAQGELLAHDADARSARLERRARREGHSVERDQPPRRARWPPRGSSSACSCPRRSPRRRREPRRAPLRGRPPGAPWWRRTRARRRGSRDAPRSLRSSHSPSHFFRSGWRSAWISGCARFALFTSFAPVSIRLATVSPRSTCAIVFTASSPIRKGS